MIFNVGDINMGKKIFIKLIERKQILRGRLSYILHVVFINYFPMNISLEVLRICSFISHNSQLNQCTPFQII